MINIKIQHTEGEKPKDLQIIETAIKTVFKKAISHGYIEVKRELIK